MHPYDDVNVIAGQSTIALELHEQVAELDAIVVPVSGGGMSSGIALATKAMNPSCKIILTAPEVLQPQANICKKSFEPLMVFHSIQFDRKN